LCAVYSATHLRESRTGVRLGVAEQYASYNTLQRGGVEVANPAGERLNSSIAQFLLGYNFTPRLGVQLNLPLIARSFRRQEATAIVNGDEAGIGDVSLVGNFLAISDVTEESVIRVSLLGGLKLPSGNSRRIKEELSEPQDGMVDSGIHGHDLALGSGSVDGIIGAQLFSSWNRLFVSGVVQYLLRTEGDFDYAYADDLMWSGGPGGYVWLADEFSLGLQAILAGESKGNDTLAGVKATDTAITALYAGPGMTFTWGTSLGADFAADLPVVRNNSALQIVPDLRLRGGLTWHF